MSHKTMMHLPSITPGAATLIAFVSALMLLGCYAPEGDAHVHLYREVERLDIDNDTIVIASSIMRQEWDSLVIYDEYHGSIFRCGHTGENQQIIFIASQNRTCSYIYYYDSLYFGSMHGEYSVLRQDSLEIRRSELGYAIFTLDQTLSY